MAGKLLDKWYSDANDAAPKIAKAGEAAADQTMPGGGAPARGYSEEEKGK